MSTKPFDASLKHVIEHHAGDWARLLGAVHPRNIRLIDSDVSTITAAADKAIQLDSDDGEYIHHPELQSSYDATSPKRAAWYNSAYHHTNGLPVQTTLVLLRPQADGPEITGRYLVRLPGRSRPYSIFRYEVMRLWRIPVEELLSGGLGILPVATLADDAGDRLPEVLRVIDRRLTSEADRDDADELRVATSVLMGLRHRRDMVQDLVKGIWPMWKNVLEDSSIIQEFVERGVKIGEERGVKIGEERGAERAAARFRNTLLKLGETRLGSADPAVRAAIATIADPDRLALLSERILEVHTWEELLA